MRITSLLFAFYLMLQCYSCIPKTYKVTSKKRAEVLKNVYSSNDSLQLENLIICNNVGTRYAWKEDIKMEALSVSDTLFDMFYKSINRLNLPLETKEPSNHCDTILDAVFFTLKNIDKSRIIRISQSNQTNTDKAVIFPVIHIDNVTERLGMVSLYGMPEGGFYNMYVYISMAIYIIKNNEIIYLKSAQCGPVYSDTIPTAEKPPVLKQENWDKLVELVMQDYIKGVNRYKEQNRIIDK